MNAHDNLRPVSLIFRLSNFTLKFLLFTTIILLTGCGDAAVKVIVVPVATGGFGVFLFWYFVVGSVLSECTSRKPTAQEQYVQQQREAEKQRIETERNQREQVDLPAGLKITDTNYRETEDMVGGYPFVVLSQPPALGTEFHMFTKYPGQNWIERELTDNEFTIKYDGNFFVQNMEDGTFRLILRTKDFVGIGGGIRRVISWEHKVPTNRQESYTGNIISVEKEQKETGDVEQQRQEAVKQHPSQDIDMTGL